MALPLLAIIGLGAAAGLAKSELVDKPAARKKNQLLADTQRLSPWTGMKPDPMAIEQPSSVGGALGGAGMGLGLGLNLQAADAAQKTADLQNQWLQTDIDRMGKGFGSKATFNMGGGFGGAPKAPSLMPGLGGQNPFGVSRYPWMGM